MRGRFVSLAAGLLIATGALWMGWRSAQEGSEPTVVEARRTSPPSVVKPGWQTVAALRSLSAGRTAPDIAGATEQPNPIPPPPQPEPAIESAFRQDLSAVVIRDRSQGPELLMLSRGAGHLLKAGDIYRDRWRLTMLTESDATLRRGNEIRIVQLFSPAAPPVQNPPPSVVSAASPAATSEGSPTLAVNGAIASPFPAPDRGLPIGAMFSGHQQIRAAPLRPPARSPPPQPPPGAQRPPD
jgi:hypothetical protein